MIVNPTASWTLIDPNDATSISAQNLGNVTILIATGTTAPSSGSTDAWHLFARERDAFLIPSTHNVYVRTLGRGGIMKYEFGSA